jgi:hypothetical protein
MLAIPAMPCTTVQKMMGAISARITLCEGVAERRHRRAGIGVEHVERDVLRARASTRAYSPPNMVRAAARSRHQAISN